MTVGSYLFAACFSIFAGLDRTAAFQSMVSRPLVAAPITGLILGDLRTGLEIGTMVELIWLGRLPVGAALPPDDTQVAVGSTFLAISMGLSTGLSGLPFNVFCLLLSIPLGKVGQLFDHFARKANGCLLLQAQACLDEGDLEVVERAHLKGLFNFAIASFGTFLLIVGTGSLFLSFCSPAFMPLFEVGAPWFKAFFPLFGAAVLIGTINVRRSMVIFGVSFSIVFLLLWAI